MKEGGNIERKGKQKEEKIGYNLITKTFYYTDIMCYLHIKNYMKLFKIMISHRRKILSTSVNFKKLDTKLYYACNMTKAMS